VVRAAAALALSVALLAAGPASALAGPGVSIRQLPAGKERRVYGSQIGGSQTIRSLLALAGFSPQTVTTVTVTGDSGNASVVRGSELDGAFVSDAGGTTRFFRPGQPSEDVSSIGDQPLRMEVGSSALLSIALTASATRVKVGETVTFHASVRVVPARAHIDYSWNFGDGTPARSGPDVSHSFKTSGPMLVTVQATGSGGACPQSCSGQFSIDIEVIGQQRRPNQPSGTPQGTGTVPGGSGTGGTGTGAGSGSGSSPGQGSPAPRRPPPLRPERPEPHSRFSADPQAVAGTTIVQGILLQGSGAAITGALPGGRPTGSPAPKQGVPGTVDNPSQIAASIALALAIVVLGALQERRRVRLRVA
jgi:hypothetical protein